MSNHLAVQGKHWVDMQSFLAYADHFRLDVLQYFNKGVVTGYAEITKKDLDISCSVAITKCGRWDIIEQLIIARMIPNQLFLELCLCKRTMEIERILLNHPHLEYLDSFMSTDQIIHSICQLQDTKLLDILANHLTMFDKSYNIIQTTNNPINDDNIHRPFLMSRVNTFLLNYHKHYRTSTKNLNTTLSFDNRQDLLLHHSNQTTTEQSKLIFDESISDNNNKFTFLEF
ncbi:hypothetical protein DFA_06061 [Cavenderia fasciculata]|uniref:Uncharacterized protein n=1 Tax=Cavenderia fasciculata TaxID=261658 RepID=F4PJZ9_CACFS|nr:uncharacterized protein DFA_06061 [Cavenderia fasciculata]EGG23923.1 hypothetical protein DFA_06061 [Cavenderia fasciculata]|eukprot:XP_004361774.1 hypothetical protein DFA_06061 [Cavenderia fasciculata]